MIAQFGIAIFGLVAIALTQSSCSRLGTEWLAKQIDKAKEPQ